MNVAQGKQVFAKHCASCHQLEDKGTNIGPDLTAISDKSMPAMLTAILDPNRAVEEKYLDYNVLTTSGQIQHGILVNESATAISIATPEGKTVSILRNQLEQLKATGKSLMPEGLEQVLSPQDVTDVVGYVQSISVPRKQFPGNVPQLAPVRNDGSIRLFAIHAEIYGPTIVLEERYHNLGFWSDHSDRAVWTIDAPSAGEYELHLDYACAPQRARNRFQIRVDGQVLGGEVDSTESWDHYRGKKVGILKLPDEPVQLTIQSEGSITGFLMDLRTIILLPKAE
jgi:putative heme-binding domain-containing protein